MPDENINQNNINQNSQSNQTENNNELRLGGSIWLVGFNELDKAEMIIIKKIVGNYIKKLADKTPYDEVKIRLKMHEKGKSYLHEINADVYAKGFHINAKAENRNLYAALSDVLECLLKEVEHKIKA